MDTNSNPTEVHKPAHANSPVPAAKASAGVIALQWLSYAFWFWLIGSLTALISITLSTIILDISAGPTIPYFIAATIVLLPTAFLTDFFYRKHETPHKQGGPAVIMILHVVLFALFAIGTLIGAVFVGLNLLMDAPLEADGRHVSLWALFITAALFGATLFRVLNPTKSKAVTLWYSLSMVAVSIVFIVLAFIWPFGQSVAARDDKLLGSGLPTIVSSISDYVSNNDQLPDSLSDLTLGGDGKQIVDRNLVEYKNEGLNTQYSSLYSKQYNYQLCVNYVKKSSTSSYSYDTSSGDSYKSYLNDYNHPAGNVCYKLYASNYTNDYSRTRLME